MAAPKASKSLLSLARAAPKLSQWVVGTRVGASVKKAGRNRDSEHGARDEVAVAAAAAARAAAVDDFFLSVGFPSGPGKEKQSKGQVVEKAGASGGKEERSRKGSKAASASRGRKKSTSASRGTRKKRNSAAPGDGEVEA